MPLTKLWVRKLLARLLIMIIVLAAGYVATGHTRRKRRQRRRFRWYKTQLYWHTLRRFDPYREACYRLWHLAYTDAWYRRYGRQWWRMRYIRRSLRWVEQAAHYEWLRTSVHLVTFALVAALLYRPAHAIKTHLSWWYVWVGGSLIEAVQFLNRPTRLNRQTLLAIGFDLLTNALGGFIGVVVSRWWYQHRPKDTTKPY